MGIDCKKVNKISLVTKENMAGQSEYYTYYIFGQKALISIGQRGVNCENTLSLHGSNELSFISLIYLIVVQIYLVLPAQYYVESHLTHSLLLKLQIEATYM